MPWKTETDRKGYKTEKTITWYMCRTSEQEMSDMIGCVNDGTSVSPGDTMMHKRVWAQSYVHTGTYT